MDRVDVRALAAVGAAGAADADGQEQLLAVQGRAGRAVGPAEGEDVVEPLLEQGRAGEPVHGVLQHDAVGAQQSRLLGGHIDVEVGVEVIHVAHGDVAAERLRRGPEGLVDPGLGDVGVEDENESVHGGLPGVVGL